ncbi:MAG: hypothetical protein PHW18_10530 [Sulfuricurvum sp.]|uniref:hypothetical protein n=1 Tax=Sulfuricurvum sp. TaxID=2025608 RepID=UPI00260E7F14|nr:hypothetical protein [Sulfuricurvum sp.]MDD2829998.1 hypothetical protein [Sulfuricurvum sp.]MDD4948397.1 hypothetical protein [Sulfuricurvum sp.]
MLYSNFSFIIQKSIQTICLVSVLAIGLATHANAVEMKSPTKEIKKYAVLKEPKTVEELLKNLKYAYDHDWFLNDDFYAEQTLKRVLGSHNDELHTYYFNNQGDEVNHLIENGKLQSYGHNFKYRQHRSDKQAQLILNGIQAGYRKGKGGSFHVAFESGVVFFEEAEAVFGRGWTKKDARETFTDSWTPSPATSEYGNLVMEYFKESEKSKGYIGIFTNEDGSVNSITIGTQEKH